MFLKTVFLDAKDTLCKGNKNDEGDVVWNMMNEITKIIIISSVVFSEEEPSHYYEIHFPHCIDYDYYMYSI